MKSFVILALVACAVFVSLSSASSVIPEAETGAVGLADVDVEVKYDVSEGANAAVDAPSRHKRFTCDIMSLNIGGKVQFNNSACGAHCFVKNGFRGGGWCDKRAICNCRK